MTTQDLTKDAKIYGADTADLLRKWDAGEVCHTIEMGGMGPGYEQAIHILVFEMIRYMLDNPPPWTAMEADAEATPPLPYGERAWDKYSKKMDAVLFADGAPCNSLHPSGAQYGAASNLAGMFVKHGPVGVMTDGRVKDRHIMVSRNFPASNETTA